MKNIFTKISSFIALFISSKNLTFAATNPATEEKLNQLLPIYNNSGYEEIDNVRNLPELTLQGGTADVIKTLLSFSMIITLIAIIVAAAYYLMAMGKDEDLTKSKSIILYLLIGMAVMASAYAVVSGLTQFEFFE